MKNESGHCKLCERHADTIKELTEALETLITVNPAFRTKNIGAPNSFARMNQELQIKAEDNAKAAIARAKGEA